MKLLQEIGLLFDFCTIVIRKTFLNPYHKRLLYEIQDVFSGSFFVVVFFAILVGMSVGLEFWMAMKIVGAEDLASTFSTLGIFRELGPMIAGSQVLIKSGSKVTAFLASAQDRGQITALEVIPVDSIRYLVVPKFWALCLATMFFTVIANTISLLSSYLFIVKISGVSEGAFWNNAFASVGIYDVLVGIIKGFIIGFVNSLFVCYYGYNAKPGPAGMAAAINRGIVLSIIIAIFLNYVLSIVFF